MLEIPVSDAKILLNRYLDEGGNYIETAASYGNGESERKIGLSIGSRRKEYILATKIDLEYANDYTPMTDEDIKALYTDAEELGNYVCRQCDQCLPCPEGVPITEIFQLEGYYDRQMADGIIKDPSDYALKERLRFWFGNKDMAINRYKDLSVKADSCTECGVCTPKCPYDIDIIRKLSICDYKLGEKAIF